MSSEWKEVEIKEYCKLQGGYAFKGTDFIDEGIPVLKIKNIQGITATLKDSRCVANELFSEKLQKFKLKSGDVLIAMTGAGSVGRVGKLICEDEAFGLLNQRVGRFDVDPEKLNKDFLYYTLIQPRFQEALFMAGSGSGQPNLSPSQIESFNIKIPPLQEQKRIAHILGSLDDKIELNRKMNQTLESMAQALFQSWFVDFDPVLDNALAAGNPIPEPLQKKAKKRNQAEASKKLINTNPALAKLFPSTFVFKETLNKWIPEGWEVKELGEVINFKRGHDLPKTKMINEGIPVIGSNGIIGYHNNFTTQCPCITIGRSGNVGKPRITFENSWAHNTTLYINDFKGSNPYFVFYLLRILNLSDYRGGSAVPTLNRNHIHPIKTIIPEKTIEQKFSIHISEYHGKIEENKKLIVSLTKTRDTLLPKLISGKIKL
jgi:type I restriction enzyme S subunit